jgi:hypothetical protein
VNETINWSFVLNTLIATMPAILIALGTLLTVLRTKTEITLVKEHVNSKMDELLKLTGESEKAKGHLEGRAEQKSEGDQR